MHITAADAARMNANEQLIRTRFWVGHIDDVELFMVGENKSFHQISLIELVGMGQ